ncbi:MAG TPA: Crp/Fnr family transcriptional regulator [Acidobacteriaceae bacterium]|jgi:CRP-like cAMP-binding protein|nr:Crp/Fnr family transcriptional regulator [Acidobacteriaceae bacterium]
MGQQRIDNLLLETLTQPYQSTICSRLEEVVLPAGTVLYEADEIPRYAWFITAGIASKMISMSDGRSAEIGLWGREGVVPCYHLLGGMAKGPARCVAQVETKALRISFPELQKEIQRSEPLRQLVMKCAQRRSMILAQLAACNRLHDAEQRLARWLLAAHDLAGTNNILLSQVFLADILGARRTTVTLAAGALRRRRLISYRRGQIQILDHHKLKAVACECYSTVRNLFQNFYG